MSDSTSIAHGWLSIYEQYDLSVILHNLRDAIISPESLTITAATAGNYTLLTIVNHNLRTGDKITIASCSGGTFTALNGTAKIVEKVDDDTILVHIKTTGTYTASSGTVTCTSLANYLSDTFSGTLKTYIGLQPENPPASSNYPAVIIRANTMAESNTVTDGNVIDRQLIISCMGTDITKDTSVTDVTEFDGIYKVEKFARLVCDYIKRFSRFRNFNLGFQIKNEDAMYAPLFVADITISMNYMETIFP